MKNKIKLTDLSHLERLNDKMSSLKGGAGTNYLCFACNCACKCIDSTPADQTIDAPYASSRFTGFVSKALFIAFGPISSGASDE